MLNYENIVSSGIVKTGLDLTFTAKDETTASLTVAPGSLTKEGGNYVLSSPKHLDLKLFTATETTFYVMLVKHSITGICDIILMQRSNLVRRMPALSELGFDLVEVLAEGKTLSGPANVDNINCNIKNWV